jgi:DNA-binding NarL/FixJ family response regulator
MTTASMTRVMIADDQEMIRSGFRMIVDAQPDMCVVGEAADGAATVEVARRLRPDVLLTDIRMPRLDGLAVTRLLAGPDVPDPIRVIVVTTFDLDEYVHAALQNGACGFLVKRSGPSLLAEAIRGAMAGDGLVNSSATVRLLRQLGRADRNALTETVDPLTEREHDIANLVAEGMTNAEIGAQLFISAGTVKTHVANIQRKVKARNRVGIASYIWNTSR